MIYDNESNVNDGSSDNGNDKEGNDNDIEGSEGYVDHGDEKIMVMMKRKRIVRVTTM